MPYRIPAINEAVIEDAREIAAFGERWRRQRTSIRRRVIAVLALGLVGLLHASAWMTESPPVGTVSSTSWCSEDTCLCWLEEHHTWARFDCTPMPAGTCFKTVGKCP